MNRPERCPKCREWKYVGRQCYICEPITPLHETARPSEGLVGCSEWVGQLEAALRDATNAQLEIETGWKDLALRKIVRCKETLAKIVEAERGRCPTDPSSATREKSL